MTDPDHDDPAVAEAIRNAHPVIYDPATGRVAPIGPGTDPDPR